MVEKMVPTMPIESESVRPYTSSWPMRVSWDVAEYVWERMLEAGRDLGITPVGTEALVLLNAVAE